MAFLRSSSEASVGTATWPLGPSAGESRQVEATVTIGGVLVVLLQVSVAPALGAEAASASIAAEVAAPGPASAASVPPLPPPAGGGPDDMLP